MRGCILAGGLSSRFGSDKALYEIDGVPLAVRVARVLAASGLEPVLVGRVSRALSIPELLEPDGPRHPLWGLAFALDTFGDVFCAPCDVDVTPEQVRALLSARAVSIDQPLLGFFPASFATVARDAARRGLPVRSVVRGTLDVGPVANLNRPPSPPGSGS